MINEKDIQGIIIPPKYSLPITSSQPEAKFVSITASPSNTIIFSSAENKAQFVITAHTYHAAIENGESMSLHDIHKATSSTGGIAVEVQGITFPEILRGRKSGIISNEQGTFVWEGNTSVMITSINSPTNPITGERLVLPGQSISTTALPDQSSMIQISQTSNAEPTVVTTSTSQLPTNPVISNTSDLAGNPYLNAPAKFEDAT